MKHCLILMDANRPTTGLELLEVARRMYGETPVYTMGLQLDADAKKPLDVFDAVITFECGTVPAYETATIAAGVAKLHDTYCFDSILIAASLFGRMTAPRIAMRLGVGLVADVVDVQIVDGQLEMIRPAYSGKMMAGIVNKGSGPLMMTIRENTFPPTTRAIRESKNIVYPFQRQPCGLTFTGSRQKPPSKDIRNCSILISGGGGVLEQFSRLDDLAQALDAQVSASRRVVDSGVANRKIQVGQSGKTVSPRLYMALGIDGSVQHVEGLRNVEHLIVVNTNKDAPICSLANLVVVGDAIDFIDRIVKRIQQQKLPGGYYGN